jgi:hypothetical protein
MSAVAMAADADADGAAPSAAATAELWRWLRRFRSKSADEIWSLLNIENHRRRLVTARRRYGH